MSLRLLIPFFFLIALPQVLYCLLGSSCRTGFGRRASRSRSKSSNPFRVLTDLFLELSGRGLTTCRPLSCSTHRVVRQTLVQPLVGRSLNGALNLSSNDSSDKTAGCPGSCVYRNSRLVQRLRARIIIESAIGDS